MSSPTDETTAPGPICPKCRQPLRENRCRWTLSVDAARRTFIDADGPGRDEITAPTDPTSRAGQFQVRCHALVDEIERLGFAPRGWISLVNQLGAVEAAKHLLAENRIMPVTEWLVSQGRGELTMERSLADPNWQELFTDDERAMAADRL